LFDNIRRRAQDESGQSLPASDAVRRCYGRGSTSDAGHA